MTNKEKYKKTFSVVQSSKNYLMEVSEMKEKNRLLSGKKLVSVFTIVCVILTCSVIAYGADVGGIRTIVRSWVAGEQRDVTITENGDYSYNFSYDEDGEEKSYGGGGIEIDDSGNERALSGEEILSNNSKYASVEDKNGRVIVYYYDQVIDITDMFGEDGFCKVALSYEGEILYVEIEHNGGIGYQTSQSNSVSPKEKELYTVIEEK